LNCRIEIEPLLSAEWIIAHPAHLADRHDTAILRATFFKSHKSDQVERKKEHDMRTLKRQENLT
jgi:hypothetical protein